MANSIVHATRILPAGGGIGLHGATRSQSSCRPPRTTFQGIALATAKGTKSIRSRLTQGRGRLEQPDFRFSVSCSRDELHGSEDREESKRDTSMDVLLSRIKKLRDDSEETARNWKAGKCKANAIVRSNDWIRRIKFNSEYLTFGTYQGPIGVVNLESKNVIGLLKGIRSEINALDFDGQYVAAGATDGAAHIWDLNNKADRNGEGGFELKGHTEQITGVHLCEGRVYTSSLDATIREWDVKSGKCLRRFHMSDPASGVQVTEDYIISTDYGSNVAAWSLKLGQKILSFKVEAGPVSCFQFDDETQHLFVGCKDGSIQLYDINNGTRLGNFEGHKAPVVSLQVDGVKLVSASRDGHVRAWDRNTKEPMFSISGFTAYIGSVQFDEERLISDGSNQLIICHDFRAERKLKD